jgi:hypothetical protein
MPLQRENAGNLQKAGGGESAIDLLSKASFDDFSKSEVMGDSTNYHEPRNQKPPNTNRPGVQAAPP